MNVTARNAIALPQIVWWQDRNMVSLVKRTAFKACNETEFDEAVAVARDLQLSPLRKQIYAFVFNAADETRRNMVLVVGIDGGRAIAARTQNYQPDDQEPTWVFSDALKNPLTNPHGIEKCTVGVYHRPSRDDPFRRIVHTVYWDEFAPILKSAPDEEYEWVGSGSFYPAGHKKAGEEKQYKRLKAGAEVTLRLDPKKDAWIKSGRNQIAKCAEMGVLRKGWPEDLSRVYTDEETHRAQTLDGVDYEDLTPSQMATQADTDKRVDLIGGIAISVSLDNTGILTRVPIGQFADKVIEAAAAMESGDVASFMIRNRVALQEFWAHNKTDALELKRKLEAREAQK